MKKALFSILGVVVAIIIIVSLFGRSYLSAYIDQELVSQARKRNTLLVIDRSTLGLAYWQGYRVTLSALPGKIPVNLDFDRIRVGLSLLKLLSLSTQVIFDGEAYGGTFDGTAEGNQDSFRASLNLRELDLAKSQQGRLLGIKSGTFSLSVPSLASPTGKDIKSNGVLSLSRLTLSPAFYMALAAFIPMIPRIPIENFSFATSFAMDSSANSLTLPDIQIGGNLGTASGNVALENIANHSQLSISLEIRVNLSAEGKKHIGGYLALAGGKNPENPSDHYVISASGNVKSPRWTVTAS